MPKLTVEGLEELSRKARKTTILRESKANARVIVHMGTCGITAGARRIMSAVMDELDGSDSDQVMVTASGCAGLCSREPMMTVELKGRPSVKYGDLTEEKARTIIRKHAIGGEMVDDLAMIFSHEL